MYEGYEQYLPLILDAAAQAGGVDPALWSAMVMRGENSRHDQVSPAGAFGRAQLMPATANEVNQKYFNGVLDPSKYFQNILLGATYAGEQSKNFGGDPMLVATAYNAGPGRAATLQKTGDPSKLPKETQGYLQRTKNAMSDINQYFANLGSFFGKTGTEQQKSLFGDDYLNQFYNYLFSKSPDSTVPAAGSSADISSLPIFQMFNSPDTLRAGIRSAVGLDKPEAPAMSSAAAQPATGSAPSNGSGEPPAGESPSLLSRVGSGALDLMSYGPAFLAALGVDNPMIDAIKTTAGGRPAPAPSAAPVPEAPVTRGSIPQTIPLATSSPNIISMISSALNAANGVVPPTQKISAPVVQPPAAGEPLDMSKAYDFLNSAEGKLTAPVQVPQQNEKTPLWEKIYRAIGAAAGPEWGGNALITMADIAQQDRNRAYENQLAKYKRGLDVQNQGAELDVRRSGVAGDEARYNAYLREQTRDAALRVNLANAGFKLSADSQNASAARGRQDDVFSVASLIGNATAANKKTEIGGLKDLKFNVGGKEITGAEALARGDDFYIATQIIDSARRGVPTQPRVTRYIDAADKIAKSALNARGDINDKEAVGQLMDALKQFGISQSDPEMLRRAAVSLIQQYTPVGENPSAKDFSQLEREIADSLVMRQIMTDLNRGAQ